MYKASEFYSIDILSPYFLIQQSSKQHLLFHLHTFHANLCL